MKTVDYKIKVWLEEIYDDLFRHYSKGWTLLFAGTGTGKNTAAKAYGKKGNRIIILCPTIALTKKEKKRKDVVAVYGKKTDINIKSLKNANEIYCTYDSLPFLVEHIDPSNFHLFVDEVHNFISEWDYRFKNFNKAIREIPKFPNVTFMTGTPLDLRYFQMIQFFNDATAVFVECEKKKNKKVEIIATGNKIDKVFEEAVKDVRDGYKVVIYFDNKPELDELEKRFNKERITNFIFSKDTKDSPEVEKLLSSKKLNHSVLLCTRIFAEGFDLENDASEFHRVLVVDYQCSFRMEQISARFRKFKDEVNLCLCVPKNHKFVYDRFDLDYIINEVNKEVNADLEEEKDYPNRFFKRNKKDVPHEQLVNRIYSNYDNSGLSKGQKNTLYKKLNYTFSVDKASKTIVASDFAKAHRAFHEDEEKEKKCQYTMQERLAEYGFTIIAAYECEPESIVSKTANDYWNEAILIVKKLLVEYKSHIELNTLIENLSVKSRIRKNISEDTKVIAQLSTIYERVQFLIDNNYNKLTAFDIVLQYGRTPSAFDNDYRKPLAVYYARKNGEKEISKYDSFFKVGKKYIDAKDTLKEHFDIEKEKPAIILREYFVVGTGKDTTGKRDSYVLIKAELEPPILPDNEVEVQLAKLDESEAA